MKRMIKGGPVKYIAPEDREVWFCNCKQTKHRDGLIEILLILISASLLRWKRWEWKIAMIPITKMNLYWITHQAVLRRQPPLGRSTGEEYRRKIRYMGAPRRLQEVNVNQTSSRKKTVFGSSFLSPLYSVSFQITSSTSMRFRIKHGAHWLG